MIFPWERNDVTQGEAVDLRFESREEACARTSWVPSVYFAICPHGRHVKIGECDLRLGMNEEIYYAGNIGYRIYPPYRGHGYAYDACVLLFQIAHQKYHMDELILTCSPENTASRKTLEKLHGNLLETTPVPVTHWLYRRGETVKNIYKFELQSI